MSIAFSYGDCLRDFKAIPWINLVNLHSWTSYSLADGKTLLPLVR